MTEVVHLFLSWPAYLFAALAVLVLRAFHAPAAAPLRRWRYWLLAAGVGVYMVTTPIWSNLIHHYLEHREALPALTDFDRAEPSVALVLTGGWLRRGATGLEVRIGEDGWERLSAALQLHRRTGARLMFVGNPADDDSTSVADGMARMAREFGLPADRILVEPASRNTYENILFAQRLIPAGTRTVWLVTSAAHMPRAAAVARRLGLAIVPYPCDFRSEGTRFGYRAWIPSNHGAMAMQQALHEVLGLLAYRARGWA